MKPNPWVNQIADLKRQVASLQRVVSLLTKEANPAGRVGPKPGQSNGLLKQVPAPAGQPKSRLPTSPSSSKEGSFAKPRNRSSKRRERRKSMQSGQSSIQSDARVVRENPCADTVKQSTVTPVEKKPVLKKMPMATGISEVHTLIRNKGVVCPSDPVNELPEKGAHYIKILNPKPQEGGQDLRSRNIKTPVLRSIPGKALPVVTQPKTRQRTVDEEITGFLIYEFMFQPRTSEVMCRMAAKAKRFLAQFDCLQFTHFELHEFVTKSVEAAMNIPTVELRVRANLQDYDQSINRVAHAALVTKGVVGRAPVKTPWPLAACFAGSKLANLPSKPQ